MFDTFPPDEWLGRIKLIRWLPHARGTLRSLVLALLNPPGIVIHNVAVRCRNDRVFGLMPGNPQIDDGRVLLDERAKRKYTPAAEVPEEEARRRLSDAMDIAAQRRHREDLL